MKTTLRVPQTLSSLLANEDYHDYFYRVAKQYPSISTAAPWQIMAHTTDGKWLRAFSPNYRHGLDRLDVLRRRPDVRDLAIISRRRIFKTPPIAHSLLMPGEDWCGRCRRPTIFLYHSNGHPGLKGLVPMCVPNVSRCFYCGAREEFLCPPKM